MFTAPPGVCELTLSGTVAMTTQVEVPTTGGDLRCVVRGGRNLLLLNGALFPVSPTGCGITSPRM